MKNRIIYLALSLMALTYATIVYTTMAEEFGHSCPQCNCPNGTCYQQVISHVCKMVEVRTPIKKTVYECKEVPYCVHALPSLIGHCDCCCPQCKSCPKYKKVLIKKEIVCGEKCEYKCVPEEVVQVVAVPCSTCGYCNQQPCQQGACTPAAPAIQQPAPAPAGAVPPSPVVDPSAKKAPGFKAPEIVIADPYQIK